VEFDDNDFTFHFLLNHTQMSRGRIQGHIGLMSDGVQDCVGTMEIHEITKVAKAVIFGNCREYRA